MTPKAYKTAALALCRRFEPLSEHEWGPDWFEFTYYGFRVGLHLRKRLKFIKKWSDDWVSIGILNPKEIPPFCDHWKWNIHYSGEAGPVREALLKELERRLERLTEHYKTKVTT